MKKIFYILLLPIVMAAPTHAQTGHIDSLVVLPTNPTPTDTIKVLAYCWFSAGGCDSPNIVVNQLALTGTAHHCIGMLTFICHHTDTFLVAPQPPGNYKFQISLLTSNRPICTPVIVSAHDTANFTVSSSSTGIPNNLISKTFVTNYYNGNLYISSLPQGFEHYNVTIVSMSGQKVFNRQDCKKEPLLINLSSGMYIISVVSERERLIGKLIVE